MQEAPRCKRCLLDEMQDEQTLYDLIMKRIALLADSERADSAEYARRLSVCRACDQLNRGTCMQCGCYVEIRAAKQALHCPHYISKW